MPKLSRRLFLKAALAGIGLAGATYLLSPRQHEIPQAQMKEEEQASDEIPLYLLVPIIGKDGKEALFDPEFIQPGMAKDFLKDNDVVFGLEYGDVPKAYPRKIMNYHEVVNESVGGDKISITWCPLTGTVLAFRGRSLTKSGELTFGVSGRLYNSNLVMYDHQTESLWPQMLGRAVWGPEKGNTLQELPIVATSWDLWRKKHPDTLVLGVPKGFTYPYSIDIYDGYEKITEIPYVSFNDKRYHPKKLFFGIRINDEQLAIRKEEFRKTRIANTSLGGVSITVLYDESLDVVRVFPSVLDGRRLRLMLIDGKAVDEMTGSIWSPTGRGLAGTLAKRDLPYINALQAYWFAWHAFFPKTGII